MRNTKHTTFKIYDFRQEYKNSPDNINHIIATDLTVGEAIMRLDKAGIDINELKPFIMLPLDCKEAFEESFRNDKNHESRYRLHGEYHGYEDGVFELYHNEYAGYLSFLEEIFEAVIIECIMLYSMP